MSSSAYLALPVQGEWIEGFGFERKRQSGKIGEHGVEILLQRGKEGTRGILTIENGLIGILEGNAVLLHVLPFSTHGIGRETGEEGKQGGTSVRIENSDREALSTEVESCRESGETCSEHGKALLLGRTGEYAGLRAYGGEADSLKLRDGKGAAKVTAQAGIFAGMIAHGAEYSRQWQMALYQLAGFCGTRSRHGRQKTAHVHVQWTGQAAARRGFLSAAGLVVTQSALFQHDLPLSCG